jgi:hypothetical protein
MVQGSMFVHIMALVVGILMYVRIWYFEAAVHVFQYVFCASAMSLIYNSMSKNNKILP